MVKCWMFFRLCHDCRVESFGSEMRSRRNERDAGGALQHNVFFSQQVSLTSTKLAIALHNTCIRSTQTMVRTPPSGCTEFPNPENGAWQVSPSGCCDENELTKLVYPQIREKKYGKNAKWPEGYCSIGERVVFHFVIIQENAVD